MQAKCPYCFGEKPDCPECRGTGQVTVTFASGTLYTLHCNACGEDNGGCIRQPGETLPSTKAPGYLDCCVWCSSEDVEYVVVGEV